MKNKLLGHMVRVRCAKERPNAYAGERGEVVYVARQGLKKHYIVQFESGWCWFSGKDLRIDERGEK